MKDRMTDNMLDLNWLYLDTSIAQARSRIDGREYPVEPLSAEQAQELADALGIELEPRSMWALGDAVRASMRNLAAFFDAPDIESAHQYEQQRRKQLERFAADPARTLLSKPSSSGARDAHDLLLELADEHKVDPAKTVGAVAIGDLAAKLLREKPERADFRFTVGETNLFDDIVSIIAAVAPEQIDAIPSNGDADKECRAVDFAGEFIIKVVDRTRASFSPSDKRTQKRLDQLKNRSPDAILRGVRKARQWHRANPPVTITTTGTIEL